MEACRLAARIPAQEYPAPVETVIKYCCKNFCNSCKGVRLHGGVQLKGFKPVLNPDEYTLILKSNNQKEQCCQWRLSKRRKRNDEGQLLPLGWHNLCVDCSSKKKKIDDVANALAMQKRHRIKNDEFEFLRRGKLVEINSLDLSAWYLFAKMKQTLANSPNKNILEELRKIAAKVCVCVTILTLTLTCTLDTSHIYTYIHIHTYMSRTLSCKLDKSHINIHACRAHSPARLTHPMYIVRTTLDTSQSTQTILGPRLTRPSPRKPY